jgi:hypothetical protein
MRMKMSLWILASTAVLALGGPTMAAPKMLNGEHCNFFDPVASSGPFNPGWWPGQGLGIQSLFADDSWITCPLPRFNTTNTNGMTSLTVYYATGNGGTGHKCIAYSYSVTGSILVSRTKDWIGTQQQAGVDTFSGTTAINVSNATSTYALSCLVPSSALIRHVTYDE